MIRKLFLLLLLVLVSGLLSLPFLLIDASPSLSASAALSPVDIDRAKALIRRNDPRDLPPGEIVTQWFDESEMALIAGYAIDRLNGGRIALELHPGRAYVQVSLRLPDNPVGAFVNATLILVQESNSLAVESLRIGSLTIPSGLGRFLQQRAHRALLEITEYASATEALNGLQILEDRMLVVYQWRPQLADRIVSRGQSVVVDDEMRERLVAYSKQIYNVARKPGLGREVSLVEFLKPMFFLASARSGDAVEENRAALIALAMYFSGVSIDRFLGIELTGTGSVGKRLTLSGRYDFAQHFLTSAALTASSGVGIADAMGLFKELDDARGGSGFSFTDLGADRAGVRFARLATSSRQSAKHVQAVMTGPLDESDFMPDFLDLPEFLSNEEFQSRYGGVGSARYQSIVMEIEARLDRCALYGNNPT